MPRKRQWPPLPHAHKASGQDRVRVNGHEVYLGKTGSDEARRNYAELIAGLAEQPEAIPPRRQTGLTVAEVVERFGHEAKARYDPEGREPAQFGYACAPLLDVHGDILAARFGLAHLEDVRDEMIRRGWCRAVINRRVVRLRTLFRWAERKALCPPGTWSALRTLEPLRANDRRVKTSPKRRLPSWAEFAAVCRHCPVAARDALLVQLFAGLRSAEARRMRAGEIDTSAETWVYRPCRHKNQWRGHDRAVALGPKARAVLSRRLPGLAPDDFVFANARGGCYTACSYPQALARACVKAGVPKLTPYDLRHLAKDRAVRAVSLDGARAMLGHASVQTTAHYGSAHDATLAAEVARRIG